MPVKKSIKIISVKVVTRKSLALPKRINRIAIAEFKNFSKLLQRNYEIVHGPVITSGL